MRLRDILKPYTVDCLTAILAPPLSTKWNDPLSWNAMCAPPYPHTLCNLTLLHLPILREAQPMALAAKKWIVLSCHIKTACRDNHPRTGLHHPPGRDEKQGIPSLHLADNPGPWEMETSYTRFLVASLWENVGMCIMKTLCWVRLEGCKRIHKRHQAPQRRRVHFKYNKWEHNKYNETSHLCN